MSDAFKQITDTDDFLGETYQYHKNVKGPKQMGVSSQGKFSALKKDVKAITEYVKVLVSGKSKASKTGKPLGNKYFIKTPGKCTDVDTGKEVERSMYINNIPEGNIPLLSGLTGSNFKQLRGLLPGMASNLNALNPGTLFSAFGEGRAPECQKVTLPVVDNNNKKSKETAFITLDDLRRMKRNGEIGKKYKVSEGLEEDEDEEDEDIEEEFELEDEDEEDIFVKTKKERKQEKKAKAAEKAKKQKQKLKKLTKFGKPNIKKIKNKKNKNKNKKNKKNKNKKGKKTVEGFGDFCELLHGTGFINSPEQFSQPTIIESDDEQEDTFMQVFYLLMIGYVLYMVYKTHY